VKIRRSLLNDKVTVATYLGDGAYGPTYGAPTTIRCAADPSRRLVLNGMGEQVLSELTLSIHPNDSDFFTPESKVTYIDRDSQVVSVTVNRFRGGWYYTEVKCS